MHPISSGARRHARLAAHLPVLLLAALAGCRDAESARRVDEAEYAKTMERFRADRAEAIAGADGWITLVGLFWLQPGENRVGSGPSAEARLPADRAPAALGTVFVEGDSVRFVAAPGAEVTVGGARVTETRLRTDADSAQTVLAHGSLTLRVIRRGDRLALRVKDAEHPARTAFEGLRYFPVDPAWRVSGRFRADAPGDSIDIINILGMQEKQPTPGVIEFTVDGRKHTLRPVLEKGETRWFVMLKDSTSRDQTYPAGRYLYVDPPHARGRVVLDFNQAYNPPCAFTAFATCPLPPRENTLALAVRAGELRPGKH
ncbi:MAG TPA: DUF1684 domain-containing protein [Longimicrobium sp.]|nr:DUF1684 domain-containing protein [Longimicrobium sp.]